MERERENEILGMEPLAKLTQELLRAALNLQPKEVRHLIDSYYQIQGHRIRLENQLRAATNLNELNPFINWLYKQQCGSEQRIKAVLDAYSSTRPEGKWAKSITGIGPVLASGLLAYIEIEKAPTVGHIWRFAGLDPTLRWFGGDEAKRIISETLGRTTGPVTDDDIRVVAMVAERTPESILRLWAIDKDGNLKPKTVASLAAALAKRPWNHRFKVLCWRIGTSFVRQRHRVGDFYGRIYEARKELETRRNEAGEYAAQAAEILRTRKIGKTTEAYQYYKAGKLPPGQIENRARRYAVKLFLAHYHEVAYRVRYGAPPPKPYPLAHLEHTEYIMPPNLHVIGL